MSFVKLEINAKLLKTTNKTQHARKIQMIFNTHTRYF